VPHDKHEFFQSRAAAFFDNNFPAELRAPYIAEFHDFLGWLLDTKIEQPQDDIISYLASLITDGRLTHEQAKFELQVLIIAGHHSTANMIALGALTLMQNPDVLAEFQAADGGPLAVDTVEELLRYLSILHSGRRRVALADIEIGGHLIRANDSIIVANDVANRDPAAFAHPDVVDIHRDDRSHGAFGFGIHQCLGQHLARLELQVGLSTLFARLPGLRVTVPYQELTYKHDEIIYGVAPLPVTWDGR
jgi:cytochrome P450